MIKSIVTLKDGTVKTFLHEDQHYEALLQLQANSGCDPLESCLLCPFSQEEMQVFNDNCSERSFPHDQIKTWELIDSAELDGANWYGVMWFNHVEPEKIFFSLAAELKDGEILEFNPSGEISQLISYCSLDFFINHLSDHCNITYEVIKLGSL